MTLEAIRASFDAFSNNVAEKLDDTAKGIKLASQRLDNLEALSKRPGRRVANDNLPGDLRAEHDALAAFARFDDRTKLADVRAAMSVGSDPDGGYMVLPAMSDGWTKKLWDQSPMRRIARVVTMERGSEFVEPLDLDEPDSGWIGENSTRGETDSPDMAMFRVPLQEQYAMPKVTQRLLDDASFDVGSWLDGKISDKFARSEGVSFINGTGVNDARGLLTYSTSTSADASRAWGTIQTVGSGGSGVVTADGLKNTLWSLRAPYRQGAVWVMNSNTANAIDQLKDTTNNYIWRTGMQAGSASSLLGYEVVFDENMPDIATNALSIAFGNFKLAYVIVERPGVKLIRDPFTVKGQISFYAYRRVGGSLANSEAVKLTKVQ